MRLSYNPKVVTEFGQALALLVLVLPVGILLYSMFAGLTVGFVKILWISLAILCGGLAVIALVLFYLTRRNARGGRKKGD